jgi:hypothetical protein
VLPIFWLGNLYFSGIIAVSLSVFLLMVDRCAVLLFPANSTNSRARNAITLGLVTLQYLIFILVLYLYEYPTKTVARKLKSSKFQSETHFLECSVIDCVASAHAESLNATKIGYGFLNSALAVFFGVLLCRYNNSRRVKQNNTRKVCFCAKNVNISKFRQTLLWRWLLFCNWVSILCLVWSILFRTR